MESVFDFFQLLDRRAQCTETVGADVCGYTAMPIDAHRTIATIVDLCESEDVMVDSLAGGAHSSRTIS